MWTSVIGLFFLCLDASYGYNLGYQYRLPSALSLDVGRIFQGLNRLSCSAMLDGETIAIKSKPYKRLETVDISSFTVGQQVNATVWKIMRFGVLLRTESGHEILVPNSQMTKAQLEKANQMLNSSEIFTIRLLTVDHVRGLLTGKFLSRSWKQSNVVKPLEGIDVEGRIFRGSVHAVYSYGVAVRIVDLGIDGIIPIASLPAAFRSKNLSSFFTKGMDVFVSIDPVRANKNQVMLIFHPPGKAVTQKDLSILPQDRWLLATVVGVTKYAIFVRPTGYDVTAFLHQSQVPNDIISLLRSNLMEYGEEVPGGKIVDMDKFFRAGDIIRVRIEPSDESSYPYQATMLPLRRKAEDKVDENVMTMSSGEPIELPANVERRIDSMEDYIAAFSMLSEGGDQTGGMGGRSLIRRRYDPKKLIVWWRGRKFAKSERVGKSHAADKNSAVPNWDSIVDESPRMVRGKWRRQFNLDMASDAMGLNEKIREAEERQMKADLQGMERFAEMFQRDNAGGELSSSFMYSLGYQWDLSQFPEEYSREFREEADRTEKAMNAFLHRGSKADEEAIVAAFKALYDQSMLSPLQSSPNRGKGVSRPRSRSRRMSDEVEAPASRSGSTGKKWSRIVPELIATPGLLLETEDTGGLLPTEDMGVAALADEGVQIEVMAPQ